MVKGAGGRGDGGHGGGGGGGGKGWNTERGNGGGEMKAVPSVELMPDERRQGPFKVATRRARRVEANEEARDLGPSMPV